MKCPKCSKYGIVTANDDKAHFRCTICSFSKAIERTIYKYDVHAYCKECARYYRIDITNENKKQFKKLNVECPYCGTCTQGDVHRTSQSYIVSGEIKDGVEPYFGYELYFLTSFDNKLVWAINREHLQYLIDYLSADLREKPTAVYQVMKTQADHLPTFMKLAKNRTDIVRALRKMQFHDT